MQQSNRVYSLDLLKGIVMIVMGLDHVRDYIHADASVYNPTDPALTYPLLFITRWVTNFCAPVFSFLAGISAYLAGRKMTKGELSKFLIKRGLWLIFLEFTILNFAWYFDPGFHNPELVVIWSLGVSMIFMALMIYLQPKYIIAICVTIIIGHNALDGVHFPGSYLWSIIHDPNLFKLTPSVQLTIEYTLVPWVAVMSLGYGVGWLYDPGFDPTHRRKLLQNIGIISIVIFFALRWINVYGDPNPWSVYDTPVQTAMSFLNVTKYPPSLLYLLITLGPALIFLARSENMRGRVSSFFSTFGRVPFFYYVIHLYLIHIIALILAEVAGFGWRKMILKSWISGNPDLHGYGFDLWVVFAVWIFVIASLYPLCRWFDEYKGKNKGKWWLSYL
ncbi:MAG: heparan-alpha-glucosaminide N-acetyltransferase domain-containing protein [Bacteroidota bacterium]